LKAVRVALRGRAVRGLTSEWQEPAAVVPDRLTVVLFAVPVRVTVMVTGSGRGEGVVAKFGEDMAGLPDDLAGLGDGGAFARSSTVMGLDWTCSAIRPVIG
jgi:hypothetical protein